MKVIEASEVLKKWYTPTNEFYSQVIDSLEDYAILTTDKELIINSWNSLYFLISVIFEHKLPQMFLNRFQK